MYNVIEVNNLGKMYKMYKNPKDKILDAFNLNFWKKNYYEEFWALRNMNLVIKKGERVGLIGNNGAGKSTLLKTIIGNVTPTEGEIRINGEIQALMELGTGFHPEFTGRQNIRASLSYRGIKTEEIKKMEEEIIDFSELGEFIDQPIRTYSAGMNARLAFSTATAITPDILIIDEVLGAGDAYFAGKCVERMRKITEEAGATVLFVSHDLNSVLQLCDRVIWIDKGSIKMQGEPLKVIKEYTATVRKREELRLKARDDKKYTKSIDGDVGEDLLFRFMTIDENAPKNENRIYNIEIVDTKEAKISQINVGGPMDNGKDLESFVIVDKAYTNWSNTNQDENGSYRAYANVGGSYIHAPFQVKVYDIEGLKKCELRITAKLEEAIKVEVYEDEKYKLLATLEPCDKKETYIIDLGTKGVEEVKPEIKEEIAGNSMMDMNYNYGNHKLEIKKVTLKDRDGRENRILEVGQSLSVEIEYIAHEPIHTPVFVFCAYMTDGRCLTQWIADEKVYGSHVLKGKGMFAFEVANLMIGKGSYIASVGVFNGLSQQDVEAESYHVIDRGLHFEVRQAIEDTIDRGICIQPFEGKIVNE